MSLSRARTVAALIAALVLTASPTYAGVHASAHGSAARGTRSHAAKPAHPKKRKHEKGARPSAHARKTPRPASPVTRASTVRRSNRCENCDRDAHGKLLRSSDAKQAFEHATGYPHGRPGYVIDHIRSLACGGPDLPSNMQWQTIASAKSKDRTERAGCR
jgi:hypothetical protein